VDGDTRTFSNCEASSTDLSEVLVRPVVKTALRRLWRDPTTLQIGLNPERALVLAGIESHTAELVAAFDGTRNPDELRSTARELGLDANVADHLLKLLLEAAVVDDAATSPGPLAALTFAERDRLAPDLASLSVATGALDGGVSAMTRRQHARVSIVGGARVGATIATLLAAAGVGHVAVDDPRTCRPADCAPAGASLADTGATRAQAAHAAIHRVSASVSTQPAPSSYRLDVVVLAPTGALNPDVAERYVRDGTPHIVATVRETTGVVGPFVVPGSTACLRCLDLHRTDRDPAWPLIAAQLATDARRPATQACDVVLATMVASVTALQVLGAIDASVRASRVASRNGTLEVTLPDWRIRRRGWQPHPACGCHWPNGTDDDEPALHRGG